MLFLVCFVFFLSQTYVEANNWESFFLERCETVPTPENAYYCPTYSWNPYKACVPWDTQYCQTSSLSVDPDCQGLDCKNWLESPEGLAFLRSPITQSSTTSASTIRSPTTQSSTTTSASTTRSPTTAWSQTTTRTTRKPATTTKTTITITTTTASSYTPTSVWQKMDPYCQANYNCSQTEIWSDSGCYTFEASPNPNCHLYCETDLCPFSYDPTPAYCVAYECSRFSNSTTTTVRPTTVPFSPIEPACPVCESSFWTSVSIITGSTLSILLVCLAVPAIVLLWRKVRRTPPAAIDLESAQNVQLLSEVFSEQSEQPRQRRRWFRRSQKQYRPLAASSNTAAGSPDQNTALLSCPTSSIVTNALRQSSGRPHSVHVPLSIINPHFSLASSSSSSSSLKFTEQETSFQDVPLDEESFFVKDTTISLIPTHLPKVTSVMCFNGDQLMAALLMQRCQLLLWLAEVYEQEAKSSLQTFNVLGKLTPKHSVIADLERRELADQFNSQQDAKLNRQHQLEMSVRLYESVNDGERFQEALNNIIATNPTADHLNELLKTIKNSANVAFQQKLADEIKNTTGKKDILKLYNEIF